MAVGLWLTRPRLLFHRIRYWLWERSNPDKPWLCAGTIRFCERHLHRDMRAMEFGSGRSTLWFAKRVGHLISIEHDAQWAAKVREQLRAAAISNVDFRHLPLDHPLEEPERPTYVPTPAYVAAADGVADRSLDLVIIDGHYRTHCVRQSVPKVAPGGFLLVDDINLWPSPAALPIPPTWRVADDSTNGIKRCIIRAAA